MEHKNREKYVSPQIEVIPVETEGSVMTSSANVELPPFTPGTGWGNRMSGSRPYSTASSSDLEDLINDILTVEQ